MPLELSGRISPEDDLKTTGRLAAWEGGLGNNLEKSVFLKSKVLEMKIKTKIPSIARIINAGAAPFCVGISLLWTQRKISCQIILAGLGGNGVKYFYGRNYGKAYYKKYFKRRKGC